MKRKRLFGLLVMSIMSLSLFSCGDSSTPTTSTPTINEVEDEIYDLYLKAREAGFTGTYEEWLESVKGPKGDKGDKGDTGAQGPKGDKGDTGTQGEKGDAGAKGDKGETGAKGDTGAAGSDGAAGTDGKSAYESYVSTYGYQGTEAEWLEDLKNGHLGTEKSYEVTVYEMVPELAEMGHPNPFKLISGKKTYKNGQKVTIPNKANMKSNEFLFLATDLDMSKMFGGNSYGKAQLKGMMRPMFDGLEGNIDVNNYRAYKNCSIYLAYDKYEMVANKSNVVCTGEEGTTATCKVDFMLRGEGTRKQGPALTTAQLNAMEFYDLSNYPASIAPTYNKQTRILNINKPQGDFDVLFVTGVYAYNFKGCLSPEGITITLTGFEMPQEVKLQLKAMKPNDMVELSLKAIFSNGEIQDAGPLIRSSIAELKNESNIVYFENGIVRALKPGNDVMIFKNPETGEVCGEVPVQVHKADAVLDTPTIAYNAKVSSEADEKGRYALVNKDIKLHITDLEGKVADVTKFSVDSIRKFGSKTESDKYTFDSSKGILNFSETGTYLISLKDKATGKLLTREIQLIISDKPIELPLMVTKFVENGSEEVSNITLVVFNEDAEGGLCFNDSDLAKRIGTRKTIEGKYKYLGVENQSNSKVITKVVIDGEEIQPDISGYYIVELANRDSIEVEVTTRPVMTNIMQIVTYPASNTPLVTPSIVIGKIDETNNFVKTRDVKFAEAIELDNIQEQGDIFIKIDKVQPDYKIKSLNLKKSIPNSGGNQGEPEPLQEYKLENGEILYRCPVGPFIANLDIDLTYEGRTIDTSVKVKNLILTDYYSDGRRFDVESQYMRGYVALTDGSIVEIGDAINSGLLKLEVSSEGNVVSVDGAMININEPCNFNLKVIDLTNNNNILFTGNFVAANREIIMK